MKPEPGFPDEKAWKKVDEADIPDLVILAAMLAAVRNVDLNRVVFERGKELASRG
jgi:hypothetical protein